MMEKHGNEYMYTVEKEYLPETQENYMINKRRSETVVESNDLIEASYKLSLNEQRLILYMASKINREDKSFRTVKVTVKEFADTFGLDYKNIYKEVKKISKSLTSKSIYVKPPNSGKDAEYMYIAWLSSVHYKNGVLSLEFSSKLEPYLLELKSNFSKYQLGDFVKFTSTYSIRLYQLLRRYTDFRDGTKYYTIDEFRRIFTLESKYPKYSNLKRRVLNTAISEINAVSDIIVEMYEDKEGKKVRGVQFKIRSKQQVTKVEKEVSEGVDENLLITVKTLLQTCIGNVVQDKDAIVLLKESKNDVSKIMQKIMLVQQSKRKIDNVIGFLVDSIRNDYQVIDITPPTENKMDYIDNLGTHDFEAYAKLSRER